MRQIPAEFLIMVDNDIRTIDYVLSSNIPDDSKIKDLHMELDGRYQACIKDWDKSMYGYNKKYGVVYDLLDTESIFHNIRMIKAKLETYRFQVNAIPNVMPASTNVNVNIDNNINILITFDQVREQVKEMSFLNEEQTEEVISKINSIEETFNSKVSKKMKWEKIRPVLIWLADKSVDVGTALLPLFLKI